MVRYVIEGGKRLVGTVTISGAKNAAVAILPASLLCDCGSCVIENIPEIKDIKSLEKIIASLGCSVVQMESGVLSVDPKGLNSFSVTGEEARQMRASYYFLGVFLSKFGQAQVLLPGGCAIGVRPIDQHIKAFEAMGASISIEHGLIKANARNGLKGASIYFDVISVGATINAMLAACKAEGTTVLKNAAREPHVLDLANFLIKMGADIEGAGSDTVIITGVKTLKGCSYSIVPDQIEAGTFMIGTAATKGDVTLLNVVPRHLDPVSSKLREMGVSVVEDGNSIHVSCPKEPKGTTLKTIPHPGFPTDLQQPMSALLSISCGRSIISEGVWEARYKHMDELKKMGANVQVEGKVAIIDGVEGLTGADLTATDLRGGAAMVIAGLSAQGETTIRNIEHIDRGYEDFEKKLQLLGADIKRID